MSARQQVAIGERLWELVRRTSMASGEEFFRELTRSLAAALEMPFCAVGEVIAPDRLRMLALWTGDTWGDRVEYEMAGTPCEQVVGSAETCFFHDGVRERFPDHEPLLQWGVESYVGTPLIASGGDVIGHLCLFGRKPISPEPGIRTVLETFASRAAAELERIRTEARHEAVLNAALDCIVTIDHEGKIVEFNPAAERVFGYSRDEALGCDLARLAIPEPYREQHRLALKRFSTSGDSAILGRRREFSALRADGSEFPIELTITALEIEGTPMFTGFVRDLTERKLAEQRVEEARARLLEQERREKTLVEEQVAQLENKLVRKTRLAAIGQVAASIAHELRNPLAAINNAVFYLQHLERKLDPKWAEYLTIIGQEIEQADRIVENLLEMSRAKAPVKETVDLAVLMRETFEQLRGERSIELAVSADSDPFLIEADPVQLRQVLGNLITNSIQAIDGRGRIELEACREDDWQRITLRDTGPGVPKRHRDSIFEPLFTTRAKGTGLGLAICRQIVEGHGGTIELIPSRLGSAFSIRLPVVASGGI